MKIEIYNEPQEQEEVLLLELSKSDSVYLDAVNKDGIAKLAIAWINSEGEIHINQERYLKKQGLTFKGQEKDNG